MGFIPVNEPLLDGNEKKYLCECIDTGWISSEGPFVKELVLLRATRKKMPWPLWGGSHWDVLGGK